jgi:hypothetical protein
MFQTPGTRILRLLGGTHTITYGTKVRTQKLARAIGGKTTEVMGRINFRLSVCTNAISTPLGLTIEVRYANAF